MELKELSRPLSAGFFDRIQHDFEVSERPKSVPIPSTVSDHGIASYTTVNEWKPAPEPVFAVQVICKLLSGLTKL